MEVVGDPSKHRHRKVRVQIDHPGNDDSRLRVEGSPRHEASFELARGVDCHYLPARHCDGTVFDDRAGFVHDDDAAVHYEEVTR